MYVYIYNLFTTHISARTISFCPYQLLPNKAFLKPDCNTLNGYRKRSFLSPIINKVFGILGKCSADGVSLNEVVCVLFMIY